MAVDLGLKALVSVLWYSLAAAIDSWQAVVLETSTARDLGKLHMQWNRQHLLKGRRHVNLGMRIRKQRRVDPVER